MSHFVSDAAFRITPKYIIILRIQFAFKISQSYEKGSVYYCQFDDIDVLSI